MMFGRTYRGGPAGLLANYKNKNQVFCINQMSGGVGAHGGGRSLFKMMDGLDCKGGRNNIVAAKVEEEEDSLTPPVSKASCKSLISGLSDEECNIECNAPQPYCPSQQCKCTPQVTSWCLNKDSIHPVRCQGDACCEDIGPDQIKQCYDSSTHECCTTKPLKSKYLCKILNGQSQCSHTIAPVCKNSLGQ